MTSRVFAADEVVVVGYGVQRRSDVTGSVSSISRERLEMSPNLNISQAIQGAIPGVLVQTVSSGAAPTEAILVRGRNSIAASNDPLIVMDGVPYGGNLSDINPNDVQSIEVLKDASAAAIYGSRGSNGVILVTTNQGATGGPRFSYEGKISTQSFINFPNVMSPEEFWEFKNERNPDVITASEREVYEAGEGTYWPDLALRRGFHNEHNLSVSGGSENVSYYVSGNFMDIQGLAMGDYFQRLTGRLNLDIDLTDWISVGTRTSITGSDNSGIPVNIGIGGSTASSILQINPLTRAYDSDGSLNLRPWPEEATANPLATSLHDNIDQSTQYVSSNFLVIDVPFVEGLTNRVNTSVRQNFGEYKEYRPRIRQFGYQGSATLQYDEITNVTVENILSYTRDFGAHSMFLTGVLGYEKNSFSQERVDAEIFPNDLLGWSAMGQAGLTRTNFEFFETVLISQMLRLNYSYDSRYLITVTTRRDGYSGFGADNKWGIYPSVSLAWNLANESFFPWAETFSELKPRISFGVNGNQAVDPYRTIARFTEDNFISSGSTQAGFRPSSLSNTVLGWESSRTLNLGLDVGLFSDRITGTIDVYQTNTSDLLLERAISSIHGISSVLQNIGETKNQGIDFSVVSRNIVRNNFSWTTQANLSFNKNEIVEIYGDGRDYILNSWFIGQPIRVNYDYVYDGVFQLDEAAEAAEWGVEPGNARLKDVNGDGQITAEDRQIIGQIDPNILWGLSNSFTYGNFSLNVFIYGALGATKQNPFMTDYSFDRIAINGVVKNFWTPDNPTNDFWANRQDAREFAGIEVGRETGIYENADFVRIRDVSLGYTLPFSFVNQIGLNRMRVFMSGRNLHTFTSYNGLDPELDFQQQAPLQREFTFGVNIDF